MNFPTMLTLGRVLVVPLIAVLMYLPGDVLTTAEAQALATTLFVLAALTDWLDGWLARKLNQQTPFGAFLDPVADKLIVCACLIILVEISRLSAVVAMVLIGREIIISALREWMAQMGRAKVVAVAMAGKVKTTLQLTGIPLLMCELKFLGITTLQIGTVVMWAATALALWSMLVYIKAALQGARGSVRTTGGEAAIALDANAGA